jgi:uncharacterized protein (DUF924 family)
MDRAAEVLEFWFGDLSAGFADEAHRNQWFSGGAEFDTACRTRFSSLAAEAADGTLDHWLEAPKTCLAYILLCDQIPRNIHRGTPMAFATDGPALNAARNGVERGLDLSLGFDERCFFYLPFEHSESLIDQHTCVGLLSQLRDQTPDGFRHLTGSYLQFAHQHRDIIQRFGRFPHRNRVLGRTSTQAELAYLKTANSFGQSAGSEDEG